MEFTDEQWAALKLLIPSPARREEGKGRARRDSREVLEGICWMAHNGLIYPIGFHPTRPVIGVFKSERETILLQQVLETLVQDLEQRGKFSKTS